LGKTEVTAGISHQTARHAVTCIATHPRNIHPARFAAFSPGKLWISPSSGEKRPESFLEVLITDVMFNSGDRQVQKSPEGLFGYSVWGLKPNGAETYVKNVTI